MSDHRSSRAGRLSATKLPSLKTSINSASILSTVGEVGDMSFPIVLLDILEPSSRLDVKLLGMPRLFGYFVDEVSGLDGDIDRTMNSSGFSMISIELSTGFLVLPKVGLYMKWGGCRESVSPQLLAHLETPEVGLEA